MKYDQKILIIRFSSIGDIILSTSPLKTIRISYPNAQITFLTLDVFKPLLEFHPDIDAILSISKTDTLNKLFHFKNYLIKKNYDIIFDLHNSLRSRVILFGNKSKIFRLHKPRFKRFLLFNFFINTFDKEFSTLKMYHDCISINSIPVQKIPKPYLKVTKSELEQTKTLLRNKLVNNEFITIIPGAAWKQKQWRLKYYIKLIEKINFDVILIGTKKDNICFDIEEHSKEKIHNFAGKTSLREALSILSLSKYVIGSDTGLTHAAEAIGKPVTMILGPTSRETGAGVNLDSSINIEKDIWCRPCSQNGSARCYRKKQYCMDLINPEDVLNSIPKL